ncbi:hypothetical protein ACF1BQ_029685 [Bradyrhizobium sp. RDT10]
MTEHTRDKLAAALRDLGLNRGLEREARNVGVMWPIGGPAPDHKSITDFRKDDGSAIRL